MAKSTEPPKTRQITLQFDMEIPEHVHLYESLDQGRKEVGLSIAQLAILCTNWGFNVGKAKALEQYESIKNLGRTAWGEPAAPLAALETALPETPADPGKIIAKCAHPGTCKDCQGGVDTGSKIRHFKDGTIRCADCEVKAAA